ncbi:CHAT domain-containing protein [Leptothoe spongobia]|uniref:CHAT domain-containing protein n=1 Tax=Leptothoe spongobia TAU-MAC 1115 TaxID=1967444 RepID=A0A947DDM4_9CYAN|nr:CHAT domain-containing protein [Leptothoe spongobia]MBT9314016.1 CHAT domain-containing protein [Leptothoe spongobia TAU-MAC 1115]
MNNWRYGVLAALAWLLVTLTVPAMADLPPQSSATAHRLGQQAYDRGQLTQAVDHWQAAIQDFAQQGDVRSQTLTTAHLAIALQDLGDWSAATGTLDQAQQLAQRLNDDFVSAQLRMVQGSLALHQGQVTHALAMWQQAESLYREIDDDTGLLQSQLNQAQALQLLGHHRQAFQRLQQLTDRMETLPASALKVTGLQNLGITLQAIGEWQQATALLNESLALAQQQQLTGLVGDIHLSLGNVFRAQTDWPRAIQHYQQAISLTGDRSIQLTAQLNRFSLLVNTGEQVQMEDAIALLPQIPPLLKQLPPSRTTVYAHVNLAESLITLSQAISLSPHPPSLSHTLSPALSQTLSPQSIAQLLSTAVNQARSLHDAKAEAYALGELGHLYETNQQWSEALDLTRTAVQLAQDVQAKEIAMPWQWQQGRILKATGDMDGAIEAYDQAVHTLQDLRQDLVSLSPDIQFSFREQVEPVYRQLAQLLLAEVDTLPRVERQRRLVRSRQLIEDLQLATLDDFFRQACIAGTPRTIDTIDTTAAVIYPILLDQDLDSQRLEVIVSIPGSSPGTRELMHYGRAIPPAMSQQVFDHLQAALTLLYNADEILPTAHTLHQWLIEPAESLLAQHSIHTLVFVPDGFLRNVPMAVLHDGNQFLIEKYTIALSPGLQLLPSSSQPLDISNQPLTLASGLSEQRSGFVALPNVVTELEQVQQLTPTETFLNQTFITPNLQAQLDVNDFPIIHLATHGQFSSKLEDTFLLTWNDRLTIQDLENLLSHQEYRQPIELLILSACQTARGDDRAALGLAGIAVRAGARSILSTLWSVADDSTAQLITSFYQNLTQQTTKAEALRQAQLSLLHSNDFNHPYFWGPFVLVGNWQ